MRELGVTQLFARSSEAKGRVERANGTFQDRLVAELRLANANTFAEANSVLESFLPRFNQRFGVEAAQPELSYRPVESGLDIDAVLSNKWMRRVTNDNKVQYRGKTLQLFPETDRPSYAGARVEVQERLDGHLLVSYKGKILTHGKAPPLANRLRNCVIAYQANGGLAKLTEEAFRDPIPKKRVSKVKKPVGLGWEGSWYENEDRKRSHRDLVLAWVERARFQGKRIGRPKAIEEEGFLKRFRETLIRIGQGSISRNQAARELGIGYATLKRLLYVNFDLIEADPSEEEVLLTTYKPPMSLFNKSAITSATFVSITQINTISASLTRPFL